MPAKSETSWYQPAAEMVAREGVTLKEAASRLAVPADSQEIGNLWRSKLFQRLLRAERHRYFLEVGSSPEWRRKTAVGMLLDCAQRLMEEGSFDKAAEVILKASRVEGWLDSEQTVNVFAGLSQKDLDNVKAKLNAQIEGAKVVN